VPRSPLRPNGRQVYVCDYGLSGVKWANNSHAKGPIPCTKRLKSKRFTYLEFTYEFEQVKKPNP
jgi:hypothetical protein